MGEQNQQTGNNPNQSQSMNQHRDQGTGQGHGIAPATEPSHIEPNSQGIQGLEGVEESDEGDSSWRGGGGSAASKQKTFTGGESNLEDAAARGGI